MEPAPSISTRARRAAEAQGLTGRRDRRYSGRINAKLLAAAEANTGLSGSALIEFALQKVAVADDFWTRFEKLRGTVDPDVDLEF